MDLGLINNDIIFNLREEAVPYNYRISYKVSLVCLIIGKCCGKKGCSIIKLQMINSAVSNKINRDELLNLVGGSLFSSATLIRFDPAISRAINYAMVEGLLYRQGNGLLRLQNKGKKLVNNIYNDAELMSIEKEFFEKLSNRLTEDIIENIARNWRVENA